MSQTDAHRGSASWFHGASFLRARRGRRDRNRSLALGLSQVELARKVGIGEQCIGRYERRQQEPSLSTFLAWVQTCILASPWWRAPRGCMAKKKGRPTIYSQKKATEICTRLALGDSLRTICKEDKMPCIRTVMNWLFAEHPPGDPRAGFMQQYLRAREVQAELMVDEILELADDTSHDILYDLDGNPVKASNVRIQRHKIQIDTRMFFLSKVLPRFGDRLLPEPAAIDAELEVLDDREIARQTALILYRADARLREQSGH